MEILRRFDMLDCKAMATPMDTNMKLLSDETSELVYMTQYRQIFESLMYPKSPGSSSCSNSTMIKFEKKSLKKSSG